MGLRVAVAADHRGALAIDSVVALLQGESCQVLLSGKCDTRKQCDYPDMAYPVGRAVATGHADRGILVCGSGIGMCIAANKVQGVRAALVHDEVGAEISRRHNDANVLCLAAELVGSRVIERIVSVWIRTEFEAGRHARRVQKIHAIEQGLSPLTCDEQPEQSPEMNVSDVSHASPQDVPQVDDPAGGTLRRR